MFNCIKKYEKFFSVLILTAAISALPLICPAESKTKKNSLPPYRASGVIPGTDLKYEKLFIDDQGGVTITINNPLANGVSFTSKFSFYNSRGEYLTGFTVSDFAQARRKQEYSFDIDDYKAFRKASNMKVLGRSGRMGKTPDDE
ncbi:MAG: hypothetical protein LBK91_02335 [Synergistaceae bacterium]|jgi:hypothetical protein|nr:hypothetical protein [Synergistaceae bacterium]